MCFDIYIGRVCMTEDEKVQDCLGNINDSTMTYDVYNVNATMVEI